jgi:hypothetical protein
MTFLLGATFVSMVLALVMSLVAWRVAREERERSDARVAALAADIHAVAHAVAPAAAHSADLFSAEPVAFSAEPVASSSRPAIVVGAGLLVFAAVAALVVVVGGNPTSTRARAASSATPSVAAPLELVALGHDRDGERLMVRGVVRNPAGGANVAGLTAVVFIFDADGELLGTGRGAIDAGSLSPGRDSTFLVSVPGASSVARYRVSFRTETGIVAHVDKRTRS